MPVDLSAGGQQANRAGMKTTTKIVVNGQTFDSVEQMRPEVREQYLLAVRALGSANEDGVLDVPDNRISSSVQVHESIIYNGKEYNRRDELPPEARDLLDHMPAPKPGDDKTRIEVKTTKVLPPQVSISSSWLNEDGRRFSDAGAGVPSWLVWTLVLALLVLLFLWLSGIRPSSLIGR